MPKPLRFRFRFPLRLLMLLPLLAGAFYVGWMAHHRKMLWQQTRETANAQELRDKALAVIAADRRRMDFMLEDQINLHDINQRMKAAESQMANPIRSQMMQGEAN